MADPRLKAELKSRIEDLLYGEPRRHMHTEFLEILTANAMLSNSESRAFYYKGKRYSDGYQPHVFGTLTLHESLHERMALYLQARNAINAEIPLTMGYVQNVLNQSSDPYTYLQLLPSALHAAIKPLTGDIFNSHSLSLSDAEKLIKTHEKSVGLIKQRLMFNLLYKG